MFSERLADILGEYAGFVPGLLVTLVVALAFGSVAGRRLGAARPLGTALLLSIGLVLSATVTPSRDAILFGAQGSGTCDLHRIGLAPLWQLRHFDEVSLNVLLFVPLGVIIALLPPTRARIVVLIAAFLLPFAVELTQLIVVQLGRACQSSDVSDNLTGLLLGLMVGLAARWLWSHRSGAAPDPG